MEKEEVIERISKALTTKKIHQAFHPIIKEFFIRAAQQYKWTEKDLNKALNSFEYLQDIQFKKMRGKEKGRNEIRIKRSKRTVCTRIIIALEYLEAILKCDVDKIEEFINIMTHELGHTIKIRYISNERVEAGIQVINKKRMQHKQGIIMDEFAEIICAKKLQKGNLLDGRYSGYPHMQSAVKAAIYVLGLTEEELFQLQWQGRKAYEEAVSRQLGEALGKVYILSFEAMLDSIHRNYMIGNKTAVVTQIKAFNNLVNKAFKGRVLALKGKASIQQLAKLDIEQTICNEALRDMPRELGINEKIKVGVKRDVIYSLSEDKMTASIAERILQEGDRILEEREEARTKEAKFYDNTSLIKEIYNEFSNYPIRLLPIARVLKTIKMKIESKRAVVKKLETQPKEENYTEKHRRFIKRIVALNGNLAMQMVENAVIEPRQTEVGKGHDREE